MNASNESFPYTRIFDLGILSTVKNTLMAVDSNTFGQFFCTSPGNNVTPNITEEVEKIYLENVDAQIRSNHYSTFKIFHAAWKKHQQQENRENPENEENSVIVSPIQSKLCNMAAFYPGRGVYSKVTVPPKKRVRTEFNPFDFLVKKRDGGEVFNIRFTKDVDSFFTDCFPEKENNHVVADQSLRKMANAISVLNAACSFRILDIHSEKGIR